MNGFFRFYFRLVTGCARDISINPLECLFVLCNKLCTRFWLRQLGIQFEWHNECDAVTTVHLFILLVNVNTDNDWRDANTRKWCRILVCGGRFFSWRSDFRYHRRWVFRKNFRTNISFYFFPSKINSNCWRWRRLGHIFVKFAVCILARGNIAGRNWITRRHLPRALDTFLSHFAWMHSKRCRDKFNSRSLQGAAPKKIQPTTRSIINSLPFAMRLF